MPRRSARLQENGYYGSDGKPVICYKETMYRDLKKLKRGFHARFDTLPDTYLDVPLDEPSGTRSSETSPANRPWRMLMFILFLCLGLFVTLTVRTEFSTNAVTKVSSGNCEDVWKHVKKFQEELEELQEKMEFLHPLSDRIPNFALETQGAKIITYMTSESYPPADPILTLFGFPELSSQLYLRVSPNILLQGLAPKTSGQCWAFAGTRGNLTLELSHSITISHVTIGHIPKNISPDESISSAPRLFSVIGRKNMDGPRTYLGTFEYDVEGRPLQMFEITDQDRTVVKFLSVWILSNWGNRQYTCIYSFRVHGKMAP